MQKIFIAGCGYIGERLARLYRDIGADVTCLVRSREHAELLEKEGFTAAIAALDSSETLTEVDRSQCTLFYLVPPPGGGVTDTRARNFISHIATDSSPAKIIYMSATSVYDGVPANSVVTEETPACPDSAMGKRRLDAENAFLEYGTAMNIPVIILRVSGIYGHGRLPLMQISQGHPLLNEAESGPSNRIHADDLAVTCIAAAEKGSNGDIFNVSDGNPSSMTTYFDACADALGYPRQPQVTMDNARKVMSPLMLSYVSQSRIVDNSRMLEHLGVKLRYPNMLDGVAASV